MIFTKSTFSKKVQKDIDFGVVFGSRNDEKSKKIGVQKHMFFCYRFFSVFFRFSAILARFWEALGPPKIGKKSKKSHSGRIWNALRIFHRFWERFWSSFGRIWMDFEWIFGQIFEAFWKDLGNIQ